MGIFNWEIKTKLPKVGMRSIKTVIATLLAIIISNILGFESPFYATFTAFICIQGTIIETSEMAIKRSIGTLIGGVFSLIYLVFVPDIIYLIPLGLLIIIYMYNVFDKSDLITISCVVFLVISFRVNTGEDFNTVKYVIDRVWETFIGILIAIVVNYYIKPPKPYEKIRALNDSMIEFINKNVINEEHFKRVHNLEEYRLKIHEFTGLIQFYYKEAYRKKYEFDIAYYVRHLTLFKTAYSHIFILNSLKEGMNVDIQQYHIKNLVSIKEELMK